MRLRKDYEIIDLVNEIQISAFLNSGWVEVVWEESHAANQVKKVGRPKKTDDYSGTE